jgi:hypothetical protein
MTPHDAIAVKERDDPTEATTGCTRVDDTARGVEMIGAEPATGLLLD